MRYTFCVYSPTGEVHILNTLGRALCGRWIINPWTCRKIGICIGYSTYYLTNLWDYEALAVAHSLQVLGINICGDCVKSLYKNK